MIDDERLTDTGDIATREEQRSSEMALQLARRKDPPPSDWDSLTCYECGEDLPEERIFALRYKCVGCKTLEEKRSKGY